MLSLKWSCLIIKLSSSSKHWSGGLPLGMSLSVKSNRECTSTKGGRVVGSHNFSIGGKFFTSSALIPFSFIDFFASCISSGLRTSMPLFLVVEVVQERTNLHSSWQFCRLILLHRPVFFP